MIVLSSLHTVNCKNGLTTIALGWTRGKKGLATIIPTKYWEKFRVLQKFYSNDIVAFHKIIKKMLESSSFNLKSILYKIY